MVVLVYLDERRKIGAADLLRAIAAFGERAARRQMRDIGRQSGNLIQFRALFVRRTSVAVAAQKTPRSLWLGAAAAIASLAWIRSRSQR